MGSEPYALAAGKGQAKKPPHKGRGLGLVKSASLAYVKLLPYRIVLACTWLSISYRLSLQLSGSLGRNMRTQQEIIGRIRVRHKEDIFGFEWHEYMMALTPDSLGKLRGEVLKADADMVDWQPSFTCDDDILKAAREYMPFAWGKANGCRGLSAGRSLSHYQAWLWLLGEDKFDDIDDYQFYGKDELVRICELLGLDASQWDDGVRRNNEPGYDDENSL